MDLLEQHFVSVDRWGVLFPERTTFLLTHLHTDHADIPRRFQYPVYTSVLAGELVDMPHPQVRPVLRPGCWYHTHDLRLPFRVFATAHTAESVGFYFPTLEILYVGDSAIVEPMYVDRPLTILYDALYEHVTSPVITLAETCAILTRTLRDKCQHVRVVHHGVLFFMAQYCSERKFRLHASLSNLVRRTARHLALESDSSPYTLVGRNFSGPCIVLSSYWFLRRPHLTLKELRTDCPDGDSYRVLCLLHATGAQTAAWKRAQALAVFEPVPTTHV